MKVSTEQLETQAEAQQDEWLYALVIGLLMVIIICPAVLG